jgi:hypothetical protein
MTPFNFVKIVFQTFSRLCTFNVGVRNMGFQNTNIT